MLYKQLKECKIMENWFNSLSIIELRKWIKTFENSNLNMFLENQPTEDDILKAKEILNKKKQKLKRSLNSQTSIWFPN